jgi:hypothetical protein
MIEDKTVIIAGIGRNVEASLNNYIESAEHAGMMFKDYQVIVYPNNSTDKTTQIMTDWGERNQKVDVIHEDYTPEELLTFTYARTWDYLPCRLEINAMLRNRVIDEIYEKGYESFDYLLWVDMKFLNPWPFEGIKESFELDQKHDWDAVFANGYDKLGKMYDTSAYRDKNFPLAPETIGNYWQKKFHPQINVRLNETQELIPVYSAFNGMGIYKLPSIKDCRYSGVVTKDYETYVKNVIASDPQNPSVKYYLKSKKQTHYDGALIGMYIHEKPDKNADIFFRCSNGYNYPILTEHVPFHMSMRLRGHDKLFINPRMKIFYSHL